MQIAHHFAAAAAAARNATAGTSATLTSANYDQFWGDLLVTGASTSPDGLSAFDESNVAIGGDGIGVFGIMNQPVVDQIGYDLANDVSEVLRVDFGRDVFDVTVTVDRLINPENGVFEQGEWVALSGGVEVGRGLFADTTGQPGQTLSFDIDVDGPIDALLFQATPYIDADGNFQFPVDDDASDYFVRQISYSYNDVVYEDAGDGADLLTGGPGADLLRGGAGADVFRYAAPGDGTAITANTYVEHTALAVDRILDFTSGQDVISFDAGAFDASTSFVTIGERYNGANSGAGSGAAFVFDGKYLSYDEDVGQEGYTAIAEVQGDAPTAGDIQVS